MGKDFRYYFQHPWSRMIVAYLVIFFNFLIFAEDPVSHSQTEANVIVVGNCFSFVTNKYPRGVGWRVLKVLLWLLAVLTGLIAGKFLFHQRLFGEYGVDLFEFCCSQGISLFPPAQWETLCEVPQLVSQGSLCTLPSAKIGTRFPFRNLASEQLGDLTGCCVLEEAGCSFRHAELEF